MAAKTQGHYSVGTITDHAQDKPTKARKMPSFLQGSPRTPPRDDDEGLPRSSDGIEVKLEFKEHCKFRLHKIVSLEVPYVG
jgi:hypothetical protein